MSSLDWILIIFLGLAFVSGFRFGFIYKLGSFIGTIVGIVVAGQFYDSFAGFFGGGIGGKIASFSALVVLTSTVIGLLFRIVNRIFNFLAVIPGIKFLNRVLGGVFGVLQRVLFFSILLYFMNKFHDVESIGALLDASRLAPVFVSIGEVLAMLLPDALRQVQSFI